MALQEVMDLAVNAIGHLASLCCPLTGYSFDACIMSLDVRRVRLGVAKGRDEGQRQFRRHP
jgi:hypothetical protein